MPETSLTDMAAVRPRGPRIFVAILVLAIVGGALWFFFGRAPGPVGDPEDPAKIILVDSDDAVAQQLGELGFEVEHGTLDELESRARAEVEKLGDATGPAAILALADQLGYGYVAFADPHTLSFGALAVSPASAAVSAEHRFAVVSVGELAVPNHHVTVAHDDGFYQLPPAIDLLRALFEQERLAATLVGEHNLASEARPLFDRVEAATKLLGGYGMVDIKARRIERERAESLVDPEEAEPEPTTIADPLESTWGFPVANGGIVLFSDRPRLTAPRDPEVQLEYTDIAQGFWLPPGSTATADRQPCETPGGGASLDHPIITAAGDMMLREAGDVVEVWSMPPTAKGCPFVRKGTIQHESGFPGWVNANGRVLRPVDVDGEAMVEVWNPDDTQPQVWPISGCTLMGQPEWISDVHFALACRFEDREPEEEEEDDPYAAPPPLIEPAAPPFPPQSWLYFVSTETGQVLAWPIADAYLPALHHRRHAKLSVLVDLDGSSLLLLTAATDVAGLFEAPPLDAALPRPAFVPEDEAGIAALHATAFDSKSMAIDATAQMLVMSPSGTHLAFEVDHDPFSEWSTNVAVLELATGKSRRVAIDRWAAHVQPRFSADGKTLVFTSRYQANDRTMTALRTTPVP